VTSASPNVAGVTVGRVASAGEGCGTGIGITGVGEIGELGAGAPGREKPLPGAEKLTPADGEEKALELEALGFDKNGSINGLNAKPAEVQLALNKVATIIKRSLVMFIPFLRIPY
jgi:hypothetical protein